MSRREVEPQIPRAASSTGPLARGSTVGIPLDVVRESDCASTTSCALGASAGRLDVRRLPHFFARCQDANFRALCASAELGSPTGRRSFGRAGAAHADARPTWRVEFDLEPAAAAARNARRVFLAATRDAEEARRCRGRMPGVIVKGRMSRAPRRRSSGWCRARSPARRAPRSLSSRGSPKQER